MHKYEKIDDFILNRREFLQRSGMGFGAMGYALTNGMTAEAASVPYRDLAERLNMTEGTVRVAVHRLRKRYKHLLRDEIAQTVATEEEIDEEIRELFRVLGS